MATRDDVIQRRIVQLLNSQVETMEGIDPISRRVSELMLAQGLDPMLPPEEGRGFVARALDAITPTSREEFGLIGAGLLSPTLKAGQGLFQIPGLFTSKFLPTDRAADFFARVDQNLLHRSEAAALNAGVSPELIADSHLFGEIIGYTVPVVASLKSARLLTGIQGPVTTLQRNFILDSVAGGIFGAALKPGEELQERALNSLRESALFGVSGLMLNGLIFAATGMRYSRARALQRNEGLGETLRRISNGEQVIIGEEGIPLAQLMNEEGYLSSSLEAYSMLGRFEIEETLVQSIRSVAEAGQSRGFVRSVGDDFTQVSAALDRFRNQFPGLKFDAVKGERGFDIHFGTSGLNNRQRAQLAREGRFAGQTIERNGATYEYVRRGKGDRLVVRNVDGKVTTIKEEGVTSYPFGVEEVAVPTVGQALYADFKSYYFDRVRAASGAGGRSTEVAIVRGLRDGSIDLSEQNLRLFESAGAITHPSEIGQVGGSQFLVQQVPVEGEVAEGALAFAIADTRGNPVGFINGEIQGRGFLITEMGALSNTPGAFGPGHIRDIARQIVKDLRSKGIQLEAIGGVRASGTQPGRVQALDVEQLMRGDPTGEGFARNYMRGGEQTGTLLDPPPIRRSEDVFEAWLKERNLNPNAEDIEAFRANFNQRLRDDIWALVPEEDMAIFQSIRDETLAILDEKGMSLRALAHTKGFHLESMPEGRVSLRDINTGARLQFGDETFARQALNEVVRTEKDPMFSFVTPGNHGMPGLTGGYDPTDGVWTLNGENIASGEFLVDLPFAGITNTRDYLRRIEDLSGVPIFSRGFAEIDTALLRMRDKLEPIGRRIAAAWKGLSRDQRIQVAEFWTEIEGSELAGTALIRAARDAGLNSKQIQAYVQSRALFDYAAQLRGLPRSRYIPNYYSRVRPVIERGEIPNYKRLFRDDPIALKEFEDPANFTRSGDMSNVEMDPEIVMHKHFRSLFYGQDVAPLENRVRGFMDMKIRDLSATQQQAILQRALPGTTKDSFVLPDPVRSVLAEYINNVRGDGSPGFATMRRFTTRLFKLLGMEADPKLFDELHGTYLSMQYGASIGLRLATSNRNAVQNLWFMYTRVGGRHGTESLRRAMSQNGFDEAVTAGAVRPVEVSVPQGDAVFEAWITDPAIVRGNNPISRAFAGAIRKGLRLGQVSRQTAQKFLVPYGSSDQVNRAWAFHWQRMHTLEKLTEFDAGKIDWDTFLDDGLPFFSPAIKQEFRTQFDKMGRNAALDWIGKQAADEAHFIYGSASTPTWMQRPLGRLLGVFGQWPLWAKEMYFSRMAHGTPKQIGTFWARTLGLMGAFANMTAQSGINMYNWIAPASFEYAGGPFTDILVQTRVLAEGTLDQKAAALQNIGRSVGSLAVPGQLFYQEISTALDQNDPMHGAMLLTLGRPMDKGNFAYDYIYNPAVIYPTDQVDPLLRSLNLEGLPLVSVRPSGAGGRPSVTLSGETSQPSLLR